MQNIDKLALIDDYVNQLVSDMDIDDLMTLAYNKLVEEKFAMDTDSLIDEVDYAYPELMAEHLALVE
jgi:hypothetical protein